MIAEVVLPSVGVVQFDCVPNETHTDEVTVTEHPVEEGYNVTDHIRPQPPSLELTGIVSNWSLNFVSKGVQASPIKGDLKPVDDRVEAAYAKLQEIKDSGKPIDVHTSLRDYTSMVIQSMSVTRDATNGNVLNISMSLKKIVVAKTQTADLPANKKKAKKKATNKGNTPKEPEPPPLQKKSAATELVDEIMGGWF